MLTNIKFTDSLYDYCTIYRFDSIIGCINKKRVCQDFSKIKTIISCQSQVNRLRTIRFTGTIVDMATLIVLLKIQNKLEHR